MNNRDEDQLHSRAAKFFQEVDRHARVVFGDSPQYDGIKSICAQSDEDCRRLTERGAADLPAIAIVGKVGVGKSWLARCFLEHQPGNLGPRSEVRTGQNATDRSNRLTWFGAQPPTHTESGERFIRTAREQMLDLGRAYVLGDTPGFSDGDRAMQMLSNVAVNSAPVKILVLSIGELRDGTITEFIGKMDGTIVLPVIKFSPESVEASEPDADAKADVLQQLAEWRRTAPHAEILEPCFMPNTRVFGGDAESATRLRLQRSLMPCLANLKALEDSVERQLQGRVKAARREISEAIESFRARVGGYVDKLEDMSRCLPSRLLKQLLGEDELLRAGLRRQLRADWIYRTPNVCFPYRSFLGILALTAGAWDKLVLSVMGSIPSWGMTAFQSLKNVRQSRKFLKRIREGVAGRVQRMMEDEVRGELQKLKAAIKATLPEDGMPSGKSSNEEAGTLRVIGLERIDEDSQGIIRAAVEKNRLPSIVPRLLAGLATGSFWILMTPPIIALYRGYLRPWRAVIGDGSASWTDFPTHTASMLFTSLILSAGPAFLLALLGISVACLNGRVARTLAEVRFRYQQNIDERFADGSLRIELTDPQLNAARFLLSLS